MKTLGTPTKTPEVPDLNALAQACLIRWRALPPEARNDRHQVEGLTTGLTCSVEAAETLEQLLEKAITEEGYTGEHLRGIGDTIDTITRTVLDGFVTFGGNPQGIWPR